ncbi:MgtC/SapB family protein [Pedomonas sp. V897]|uniref:MgtC/SapB family protein n=1 Tax=Pedomonas sp. V897 TaxID=3446482 RepID=UPI003EE377CD
MDSLPTRLAVALAIGLLVGLERGWHSRGEQEKQRAAGFRTFALSGLLGGIAGALGQVAGPVLLGLVFLGYTGAFAAFHWLEAKVNRDLGVTSVVAGMLTFVLGAYAVMGNLNIAIGCAVAVTLLLALREPLHRWIAALRWEDIRAVLILLAMSFLLLPILPNRTIDPWESVNPARIWLLAILIASISFGGYVAMRVFGQRLGIVMAALAGGLASSTATTLALARLGRGEPASARPLAAGILISCVVMAARVGVVATLLNPSLLPALWPPLAAGGVVLALGALALLFHTSGHPHPVIPAANPLELGMAIKLALAIGVIMLVSEVVQEQFGSAGTLVVAAVSGVVDVDAITISVASMEDSRLGLDTAIQAIVLAAGVNTLSKVVMAFWVGGAPIGRPVALGSAAALAAAGAALLVV